MTSELLWRGFELMLVGMGTVFAFLTLLVLATALMSRLVLRWHREPGDGVAALPSDESIQGEEVAAVAAALEHHRRR